MVHNIQTKFPYKLILVQNIEQQTQCIKPTSLVIAQHKTKPINKIKTNPYHMMLKIKNELHKNCCKQYCTNYKSFRIAQNSRNQTFDDSNDL